MSMYLEVYSKIWKVWGDGVNTNASMNLSGYPFNLDLAQMPEMQIDASCVNAKGTELYGLSCDLTGTVVTLAFHPPLEAGANILVRLRARIAIKPPTGDTFVGVFTVSVQDDRILLVSHGLIDGNHIRFALDDPLTCALPTPLAETSSYYVIGARGNDFQVTGTSGGPVINLTDKGIGSNEVWKKTT